MQIEESGHIPLPSVVAKALSRPMNKTPIEQTSERLSTYDTDENEEACRAVARKNAQGLSASEREQFVTAFVAQHSDNYKTTYNSSTGSFLNLAEKLQFERWLEKQFMNKNSGSAEHDSRTLGNGAC
jgi:hypothetical protein